MADRKKRKKDGGGEGGAPAWMVTYGDLMSLLLTFFVLLLSFSTINEQEFKEALRSLRGALGLLPHNVTVFNPIFPDKPSERAARSIRRLAIEMKERMQVQGVDDEVKIELDEEEGALRVSLPSSILFASASAELRRQSFSVLSDVGDALAELPGISVEVRGHTDSRPLQNSRRFADNWDLSYFRAKAVKQYLTEVSDLPESELEVVALGPSEPVADNETPEGRLQNRRVELYIRGDLQEGDADVLKDRLNVLVPQDEANPPAADFDIDLGPNTEFIR